MNSFIAMFVAILTHIVFFKDFPYFTPILAAAVCARFRRLTASASSKTNATDDRAAINSGNSRLSPGE